MIRSYAELPQMNMPFAGAKLAILYRQHVLTILRDDKPDIPFPAFWDLPGGAREDCENPLDCALRETREEIGLVLRPSDISCGNFFGKDSPRTWFFVHCARTDPEPFVRFGSEGQRWCPMPMDAFLAHPKAVPHFKERLSEALSVLRTCR